MFEPDPWNERYSGHDRIWSGRPNEQLVTEVTPLTPGTALDVGCGEGGDVIWLAQQGWRVTGADFSVNGLARAATHAEDTDVGEHVEFWQVDARSFDAGGRQWDLVTTHYLHPSIGMADVLRRLAGAVAPGGHLLVVGHAPGEHFSHIPEENRRAMFLAEDLVPVLPEEFEILVAEQRPRTVTREGRTVEIDDATLLAKRPVS